MKFILPVLIITLFTGCRSNYADSPAEILPGQWLIVFPEHKLYSEQEKNVYARYQDSIVSLYGLKLISFGKNGKFVETDSFLKAPGKWQVNNKTQITVREGGKGFNPFKTSFHDFKNNTLGLQHLLSLENEEVKLVWHLKKIDDNDSAAKLFSIPANRWRQRPSTAETEQAIKKRLAAMLDYFGTYFLLVGKESSYFMSSRVPLPFRYYQHAIDVTPGISPAFAMNFYEGDAVRAHAILAQTLHSMKGEFDRGGNFVVEYGLFLKKMAKWINYDI